MKKITCFILLSLLSIVESKAQVADYLFNESTEVYTPVSGFNSIATGDDGSQNNIPIGFNFFFGNTTYNSFSINTNGWIRLGGNVLGQSFTNLLGTTSPQSPLIAAFWDDHNRTNGNIAYSLTGSSPNRILEVGWDNINIANGGHVSTTAFASFKMRLYENGKIEFVYGPTMNWEGNMTASIGLNDNTSFLSVTPNTVSSVSNTVANNGIGNTQFVVGKKFTFTPQPSCTGTPAPGYTLSSVASTCSGVPFTLSLQNFVSGSGIIYQWQSSAGGVNFDPIAGANSSSLTTSQFTTLYYRCMVSCGGNTAFSTPIQVITNNPTQCYCYPTYNNGMTSGDLISNVVITGTTLSNNTGTAPVNPYYTYFTGQPNYTATLQAGLTYEMQITVGTYENQNQAVWIDYNDNGIFEAEERVGFVGNIDSNGTGIFDITLSCTAPAGVHRMRIRDVWANNAEDIDPCANYGYGETEDYDVTILGSVGCDAPFGLEIGQATPTSAELLWQPGCGQISWDLHITENGGGLPTGEPTNPDLIEPTTVVAGLQPSTTYDVYVRGNCGANGDSAWTQVFTFTTAVPGPSNDDCEGATALIPGVTFEEHAVIGTNVSATKTLGQPAPTCAIFGFGGDVWYSTIVPADGNITVEVRANAGSPFIDSGMTAFTGACGNFTTLACSDDEGIDAFSRLDLTGLTPNETIYIRVWEYANDTYGTFQVSAWSPTLAKNGFDRSQFKVYPNPVKDILNITSEKDISNVAIFNLIGQQIIVKNLNDKQDQIDVSKLPAGTYLVKVTADSGTDTIKVVKQ